MILGEQSYIEQDIRDAFMASGTVHILSISGSHLGLLSLCGFCWNQDGVFVDCQLPWLERLSIYLTATQLARLDDVTNCLVLYALGWGGNGHGSSHGS